jgi:hypothetical protein
MGMHIKLLLKAICAWCDANYIGTTVRASTYIFPVVECIHLLGMVLLLGTLVVVDLRLLGFGLRRQPVSRVAGALAPVTWTGLTIMSVTGFVLFCSEALKCYGNVSFPYKMVFYFSGLIVYFTLHRSVTKRDDAQIGPVWGKVVGVLSLCCWFGVALAGRAIGFT